MAVELGFGGVSIVAPEDLVAVKTKKEGWFNVYKDNDSLGRCQGKIYGTKEVVLAMALDTVVDCVKIVWEE